MTQENVSKTAFQKLAIIIVLIVLAFLHIAQISFWFARDIYSNNRRLPLLDKSVGSSSSDTPNLTTLLSNEPPLVMV